MADLLTRILPGSRKRYSEKATPTSIEQVPSVVTESEEISKRDSVDSIDKRGNDESLNPGELTGDEGA